MRALRMSHILVQTAGGDGPRKRPLQANAVSFAKLEGKVVFGAVSLHAGIFLCSHLKGL